MYTVIAVSPVKERIVVVTTDSTSMARETVFTTSSILLAAASAAMPRGLQKNLFLMKGIPSARKQQGFARCGKQDACAPGKNILLEYLPRED